MRLGAPCRDPWRSRTNSSGRTGPPVRRDPRQPDIQDRSSKDMDWTLPPLLVPETAPRPRHCRPAVQTRRKPSSLGVSKRRQPTAGQGQKPFEIGIKRGRGEVIGSSASVGYRPEINEADRPRAGGRGSVGSADKRRIVRISRSISGRSIRQGRWRARAGAAPPRQCRRTARDGFFVRVEIVCYRAIRRALPFEKPEQDLAPQFRHVG